ncbi:MAG: GTP 3',8-cyclase MoaA [Candidatus Omnitrophica bacterium]|nr:GTP 3',8-cyclase MoaA [Candidatus Omnitrophota bacterium]
MPTTLQAHQNYLKSQKPYCIDLLNRGLRDVRISLIDQCNFFCPHCKPGKQSESLRQKHSQLEFNQIIKLAKIFIKLGVKKIRLTGGEPLLRDRLPELISKLKDIGVADLALTTNGYFLSNYIYQLKKNGLDRITVSLNALDENIFKKMTGGHGTPKKTLQGIQACEKNGFLSVKINVLVKKGINENQIIPIATHFRETRHIVRFIEYMDVGTENNWSEKDVVTSNSILKKINKIFPLVPLNRNYPSEVASRYIYKDGKGEVGFISSISQPFCQDCQRLRLSSDGKLYTCLFAENSFDLKEHLHKNDSELSKIIQNIWKKREDQYSEMRFCANNNGRNKIEMYKIGG